MRNIEVEDRMSKELLTANERFTAAEMILKFDKIKERYEKNKNHQAEVDQLLKLGYKVVDEEQRSNIFEELKRLMIDKLGCKEEWFEDAFLRQIRKAHVEQVERERQAKEHLDKNQYKN